MKSCVVFGCNTIDVIKYVYNQLIFVRALVSQRGLPACHGPRCRVDLCSCSCPPSTKPQNHTRFVTLDSLLAVFVTFYFSVNRSSVCQVSQVSLSFRERQMSPGNIILLVFLFKQIPVWLTSMPVQ